MSLMKLTWRAECYYEVTMESTCVFLPSDRVQLVSWTRVKCGGRHHDTENDTDANERAGVLNMHSFVCIRKGGPLLMPACLCVSERRSLWLSGGHRAIPITAP